MSEIDSNSTGKGQKLLRYMPGIVYIVALSALSLRFFVQFASIIFGGRFITVTATLPSLFIDFRKYYAVSALVLTESRQQIYDPILQLKVLSKYTDYKFGFSYSEYPPFFFPLVAPFTILPIELAYLVWFFDSVFVSGAALTLLGRFACGLSWRELSLLFMCTLLSAPSIQTFALGQSSYFLLAIMACFCWTTLRKIDIVSGIAIAVSTIKPQYAPFLCIIPLATGRWLILLAATIMEAILLCLAGGTIGWKNVIHYPRVIAALDSGRIQSPIFQEFLVSIRQPLKLLPYPAPLLIGGATLALAAAALFYLWLRSKRKNVLIDPQFESAYSRTSNLSERWLLAATIMAALALSFHTHLHDCVLLSIPAVLTVPTFSLTNALKLKPLSLKLWTVSFLLYPLVFMPVYVYIEFSPDLKYGLFFLFNLLMCLLSFWIAWRLQLPAPAKTTPK